MPALKPSKAALPDDPPPERFGSWRNVYLSVVGYLVVLIALFYAFRMVFER
jgi:hypothetical protein